MDHRVLYARASINPMLHQEEEVLDCRPGVGAIIVVEVEEANDRLLQTQAALNFA